MGGRGASSGFSVSGKRYGTEYETLFQSGNIKFVRHEDSFSAKSPMETMTKGRVYVTVNRKSELVYISYYDKDNKRSKTIDLNHYHNRKQPHVHHGYEHSEYDGKNRATGLSIKERAMVEKVYELWHNKRKRK